MKRKAPKASSKRQLGSFFPLPGGPYQQSQYQQYELGQPNAWNPNLAIQIQPSIQLPYQLPTWLSQSSQFQQFPFLPPQQPQPPFGQFPYPMPPQPGLPFQPPYIPVPFPTGPWTPSDPYNQQQCYQQVDTCPKDYYCVTYFNNALSVAAGGKAIRFSGFCCPNPPPACPVGEPWALSDTQCNNCPVETYFCYTDRKYGTKACCPKACNDGMTYYPDDGQCRPSARLGDQCDRDDQCGYANSRCVNYQNSK